MVHFNTHRTGYSGKANRMLLFAGCLDCRKEELLLIHEICFCK